MDPFPIPQTESRNPAARNLDALPTLEILQLMNAEDARVAEAVAAELPSIALAVDRIAQRMRMGGRLVYVGAGTSGRLGLLDAAECPPTFGLSPDRVVGLVAGGEGALFRSVEGAEDDPEAGRRDIQALEVSVQDCVVGIAASGSTPYVLGALQESRQRHALVVSLACSRPAPVEALAEISIAPRVGPEVIAGSTRLKAGTAQKMVLNMISTAVMVRLGKTYGDLMVDLQPTNAKLRLRARHIVVQACGVSEEQADLALQVCEGQVKTAIVSLLAGISPQEARRRLQEAGGFLRTTLEKG